MSELITSKNVSLLTLILPKETVEQVSSAISKEGAKGIVQISARGSVLNEGGFLQKMFPPPAPEQQLLQALVPNSKIEVITDKAIEFDRISPGYVGPLYAEISPLTFSVLVHQGSRLSQLRLRRGDFSATDGIAFTIDLIGFGVGQNENRIVGYRAKQHAGIINIENINHYKLEDYWDPIIARNDKSLILDPDEFYILASKEAVSVPPDQAAEMRAYDTLVGEFRVHYAGFFDPGFGHEAGGGVGSRAVLEVRSHDVPFVLEDGQMVGRLVFEPLTNVPNTLYGSGVSSNYQNQGLKLSKHFISKE